MLFVTVCRWDSPRNMPANPKASPNSKPAVTNELLRAVANEPRRQVVYYLRESYNVATVDELTTHLSTTIETELEGIAVQLHHQILPQLIEAGLIAVDRESDQVQYVGGLV